MDHLLTATIIQEDEVAMHHETMGYASAARRGDILPLCMRLASARARAEWTQRTMMIREVGPECPQEVLDRACSFMPSAPEPRLLRAARSLAIAARATCRTQQSAWLAFAQHDLLEAARLDPMDPTVRGMLADLVGSGAWAFHAQAA